MDHGPGSLRVARLAFVEVRPACRRHPGQPPYGTLKSGWFIHAVYQLAGRLVRTGLNIQLEGVKKGLFHVLYQVGLAWW